MEFSLPGHRAGWIKIGYGYGRKIENCLHIQQYILLKIYLPMTNANPPHAYFPLFISKENILRYG